MGDGSRKGKEVNSILGVVVDVEAWAKSIVEVWAWSADVLENFVSFLEARRVEVSMSLRQPRSDILWLLRARSSPSKISFSFADVFDHLRVGLLSPYQPLRLATLRFLSLPHFTRSTAQDHSLAKLIATEEVPIDFDGYKDRVNKTSILASDGKATEFDIVAPWLLAQLKVNLRPLWAPAITVMSGLVKSYSVNGWALVFTELLKTTEGGFDLDGLGVIAPLWQDAVEDEEEEPFEAERSWNDLDGRTLKLAVMKLTDVTGRGKRKEILKVYCGRPFSATRFWTDQTTSLPQAQIPLRKLDVANYEAQLLAILRECPHVAERHHQPLISHFLAQNTPPMPRIRLMAYLSLFSKFRKPAGLHESDTLRRLYRSLIAEPDRPLQRLVLPCLYAFQSPHLKPYEERLNTLLDERGWRAGLGQWNFDEIAEHDREEVIGVVMRLLYGLLLNRKGGDKSANGRTAILSIMGRARPHELGILLDLMLRPFGGLEANMPNSSADAVPYALHGLDAVTKSQMSGFLLLLQDVVRVLGPKLVESWPALVATTVEIAAHAQAEVENAMDIDDADYDHDEGKTEGAREDENADPYADVDGVALEDEASESDGAATIGKGRPRRSPTKYARNVRKLAFKRLEVFFTSSVPFDYKPYIPAIFSSMITPRLQRLTRENMNKTGSFLPLIVTWSRSAAHVPYLQDYDPNLLPTLFNCLSLPHVGPDVVEGIFDIVDNFLQLSKVANDSSAEKAIHAHIDCLLRNLYIMMERKKLVKSDSSVQRQVEILSLLAPYIGDQAQAAHLVALILPPLQKTSRAVPERVKANLLRILANLIPLVPEMKSLDGPMYSSTYDLLSRLFDSLRSAESRQALVSVFNGMIALDESIGAIQDVLKDLNSFNVDTGEADIDRRLTSLARLNEVLYLHLTAKQW